ncbi:MAG: phytanoyl-CoA dioxygenase family protein [Mycobacteriales bacterium]
MTAQPTLLNSVQMAQFVAAGMLRFDGIIDDATNQAAMTVIEAGLPGVPAGIPLSEAYADQPAITAILGHPRVAGAIASIVGPAPLVDHHATHVRPARGGESQHLHADAIIDIRTAFDIQLMYYPHEVTPEMGGTLVVPGSHLRRINETDIGRYQNLRGQIPLTCPAGTVLILHHGIWHCGRRNDSDQLRYMYKIRLNPTVRQERLWNTTDLDSPEVEEALRQRFAWYENATARLELINRARLWRHLTGEATYDFDYWLTRIENEPTATAPA